LGQFDRFHELLELRVGVDRQQQCRFRQATPIQRHGLDDK
jgi:hypothetical protein